MTSSAKVSGSVDSNAITPEEMTLPNLASESAPAMLEADNNEEPAPWKAGKNEGFIIFTMVVLSIVVSVRMSQMAPPPHF